MTTNRFILDSYALIAFFEGAAGSTRVDELLQNAFDGKCQLFLSVVNLGEVLYIAERERGLSAVQEVLARIDELPVEIINVDRAITLSAAHTKAQFPISYADCFAIALAMSKDAMIVTGDPEFQYIESASDIKIDWLKTK